MSKDDSFTNMFSMMLKDPEFARMFREVNLMTAQEEGKAKPKTVARIPGIGTFTEDMAITGNTLVTPSGTKEMPAALARAMEGALLSRDRETEEDMQLSGEHSTDDAAS